MKGMDDDCGERPVEEVLISISLDHDLSAMVNQLRLAPIIGGELSVHFRNWDISIGTLGAVDPSGGKGCYREPDAWA